MRKASEMPRSKSLPVVRECPPVQPCVLACRWNVLWDVTAAGSICIAGGPKVKRRSNGHTFTRAEIADAMDAAADALAERARAIRITCAWVWIRLRPQGISSYALAVLLDVDHQRVMQIEHAALAVVASALLSHDVDAPSWTEPHPARRYLAFDRGDGNGRTPARRDAA